MTRELDLFHQGWLFAALLCDWLLMPLPVLLIGFSVLLEASAILAVGLYLYLKENDRDH